MKKDIEFKFDEEKSIEIILYLAKKIPEIDVFSICKLFYLIDKVSLEERGRFICGEKYVAMQNGAVPSKTFDLLKKIRNNPTKDIVIENEVIIPQREPNPDFFSQFDVNCIKKVVGDNKDVSYWERGQQTHDGAYKKAWDSRGNKKSNPMPVLSIAKEFPNSEELIDYLVNN